MFVIGGWDGNMRGGNGLDGEIGELYFWLRYLSVFVF